MWNKQVRDHFDSIWTSLQGLKASEIEYKIDTNRQIIQSILGANDLDKIRNSSLLRLLLYEFIIFADEKSMDKVSSSSKRSTVNSTLQDSAQIPSKLIRDIKQILFNVEVRTDLSCKFQLEKYEFKSLVRKLNNLQQELKESSIRQKEYPEDEHDPEGTEAMIEQLEHILKKKEKRIKELNSELQQNFADKEELEIQIEALEDKNIQLEDIVKSLEEENKKIKQEFEKYKISQKEQLLCGASEFMNGGFPHKQSQINREQESLIDKQLLSSTQILSRYVNSPQLKEESIIKTPPKNIDTEVKTVKKATITRVLSEEYHGQQEENLLQSMKIYHKKPTLPKEIDVSLQNQDNQLQRILLTQAVFIQRVMESMV